ncbi:Tetratricopeptide repeat-containing protein [Desulfovibrio sp. X2]|uniref:tetratricopeptide repeat protein n=1 Tax=Desulfovibrio sp. X2 TaxID=941449 RepID=UPI000358D7F7|nr:tetratricopeptide repeat protein [Desulfovibrio sp. X2]EPR44062.1 Tetratricopeptide repeat-containing protein [Desulfovibrio sp. X2]
MLAFVLAVACLLLWPRTAGAQDPEDQLVRAAEWEARGQPGRAAEAYSRVLAVRPRDPYALYRLGVLDFLARRYSAAAGRFDAVLAVDPENLLALAMRGMLALQTGQRDAARRDFTQALRLDPNAPLPGLGLTFVLLADGKRDEALACFERARKDAQDDPGLLRLCVELARAEALPANARVAQDVLVELAPRDAGALIELGWCLLAVGEQELAMNAWRQTLRLVPGEAGAVFALDWSLREAADRADAAGDTALAARRRREADDLHRPGPAAY